MLYTVGEMAKLLGVAASTLRFYDKEGLLPFVQRTDSGMRMFSEKDYEWLKIIECLKKTGMPLKDIRDFIYMVLEGNETIDKRLELFKKQQKAINQQINELRETLDILDYKCWYYETAKAFSSTSVPNNMTDDEIPPEFVKVRQSLKKG